MITPITGTNQMAPTQNNGSFEARLIAVVIALAAMLWLGVEYLGGQMNWPPKFVFLADLSAGAAFLWAMIATYRLWRKRQA
jgi:hypothetical protein